ncbi:sorting nexin-10A [Centropristis striata]|uniref:sorting nexin-10A n=1 Tax=Centropristis striata TaxID=184440 RepID=UPI0027E1D84C|nr:sorting nexin-10A [Centropristis striata]
MDKMLENLSKTEFVSICVQDPRFHRDDLWHTHVDYEICLQTNSMCFRKKTSCVRRRYSEFVWLRQCLEQNALMMELPKLPSWNPFFSLRNTHQVSQRMKGFQEFLERVLHNPLLLSDSRLHLFLQSDLSIKRMERCALGKTKYTVAEAIQRSSSGYISGLEDKASCDSDCESSSSSGLGHSVDTSLQGGSSITFFESPREPELFSCRIPQPTHCSCT